ncbi:MAG TPA: CoA-binding protein [Desulfobacteraceae bacterium]|nr:CoA-binding protein [Desulfobacteraceae bacterium]
MIDPQRLIDTALSEERPALADADAKVLLANHGIPLVPEARVQSVAEAAEAARRTGFPVVLKGYGPNLLHKTEQGLVRPGLASAEAVAAAAEAMAQSAGAQLEGFLVQPQVEGRREFVAGIFRDAQFGPVILFGLGGVFTEALADVALRLAPLTRQDAAAMLAEIRARRLLEAFRGEAAVNKDRLIDVLLALSDIAVRYPRVAELDINPLLITPGGDPVAVDALVTVAPSPEFEEPRQPVSPEDLGALFQPRRIAFIGASAKLGKWGNMLVSHTLGGGYGGEIFLVNPKGGTIFGRPVYRQVADLPEGIDLAVITVPAAAVPSLIPQLAARRIRYAVLISSGFGETGAGGRDLEAELVRTAREAGVLILGPNTMGICNPHIRLYCTGSAVQPEPGSTAMVAQSGNMGVQLLAFAEDQGIGIRAFCGSGNEAMITIEDYLEGFAVDRLTRTVLLYVESVKDGRRFFENARRVGRRKPVVLLKGGQSEAGRKAAASHTGAMAGDRRVFDAVCRQAGIVKVDQPMDLLDLAAAFASLPLPRGNRVAIMTLGGGWGVIGADLCAQNGLDLPELSPEVLARCDALLPPYWSRSNPIDLVGENDPNLPLTILESLMAWEGCDAVVNLGILGRRVFLDRMGKAVKSFDPQGDDHQIQTAIRLIKDFEAGFIARCAQLMERYQKPILGVSLLTDATARTVYPVDGQTLRAVFYPTPERAIRALARMVEYARVRETLSD